MIILHARTHGVKATRGSPPMWVFLGKGGKPPDQQRERRGLYGEYPERASPSPSAVAGTSPYNLWNGTAGKPRL
jgi:hypothetical protein